MPDPLLIAEHQLTRTALAVLVVLSFSIYQKLNERAGGADVLMTGLDRKIPFLPAFSVPYLLFIPYLFFITIYGIVVSPYYAEIAASALAIQLIAAVIYWRQQTHVPRPPVTEKDVFSRLTAYIYGYDRPYCAFPSLHVAYSVFCAYWSFFLFPALAPFCVVLTAAIVASTLFIKQHVIADVFAGVALTLLTLAIIV